MPKLSSCSCAAESCESLSQSALPTGPARIRAVSMGALTQVPQATAPVIGSQAFPLFKVKCKREGRLRLAGPSTLVALAGIVGALCVILEVLLPCRCSAYATTVAIRCCVDVDA